jgi:putative peptidoglycan lipid II flippase
VTLPAVARQHALDDLGAFGKTVEEALRFGFYLTLPASIGLAVVAQPVIALIYQHGNFKPYATAQTALALQAYTIGLAGYSGIKILVPCFYAMQPERASATNLRGGFADFVRYVLLFTPSRVSLIGIALNLVLCAIFFFYLHLGQVGLALATGLVAILNFLQLVHAIQKQIDLGRPVDWLSFFVRVSLSAFACGLVAWLGDTYLLPIFVTHRVVSGLLLCAIIASAGGVYFLLTTLLGLPESLELSGFVRRKLGKK